LWSKLLDLNYLILRIHKVQYKKFIKFNFQSIWNKKNNFNYIKKFKKNSNKKWESKLQNKINFLFDWRVKLKRKKKLAKGPKKYQKNEDKNWHKNKNNVLIIEGWNWKK
jgi:hypothetical protein